MQEKGEKGVLEEEEGGGRLINKEVGWKFSGKEGEAYNSRLQDPSIPRHSYRSDGDDKRHAPEPRYLDWEVG